MSTESPHEVFERIHAEHDALKAQIRNIHQSLDKDNMLGEEIAKQLRDFQTSLVDHFWSEENDGFFDEVTNQAPNLTPDAHKLCAEHQEMLSSVSELARFASAGSHSETWWRELKTRFQAFSKQLMHHESAENALIQQAYQEDIGTRD